MEPQATDNPAVDEEVAFWRGFIAWWAREKTTPVPARALLRERLTDLGLGSADDVARTAAGEQVSTAGLVINRQRPASANNVTFVTLEDESGQVNLVVFKQLAEQARRTLLGARLMGVHGEVQREAGVTHLVAKRLMDYSHLLGGLVVTSRDFH